MIADTKLDIYFRPEQLNALLHRFAEEAPDLCRLHSIGITREGRALLALEITDFSTGNPDEKPGYYAEACTHAEEYCGANMVLRLAQRLLCARDTFTKRLLQDVVFYLVPCVNPDGVETIMATGMQGVSNGKYPLEERQPLPGLYPWDIDGNCVVAQIRVPDPDGEWKISDKDPRLMTLRKPYESEGVFYRMYPEGYVRGETAGFDVPMPLDVNLNRNYPAHWQPEGMQYGACELPLSEPETRAVALFISARPNIAGVISYHTNAGAIMRPFAGKGDDAFLGADLSMYEALGAMGSEELDYKVMSTFGGFTPDKTRMRGGTLSDWTFDYLGIPSIMLELWSMYDAAGVERPKNFHFSAKDENTDLAVLRWADKAIGPTAYLDWTPFEHPQLGLVEVGGWNRILVERNPPQSYLPDLMQKASAFALKLAAALPRLAIRDAAVTKLDTRTYKVTATIKNTGYLPTYLSEQAHAVHTAPPVSVKLCAKHGSFSEECCTHAGNVGDLAGRFGRDAEWSHDRAMWQPTERKVEWVFQSDSPDLVLEITAGAPRCGTVRAVLAGH